jgi:Xaa-Pro dipeptidase
MTHNAFFPDTEYTARLRSVREAMGQKDVDVLLITSPENIYYLTGLNHQGYFAFTMLIFPRDGDAQIVARAHEEVIMAERVKLAEHIGYGEDDDPAMTVVKALKDAQLGSAKIGLEKNHMFFPPGIAEGIQAGLPTANWKDGSDVVDNLRLIKSPLELECTYEAANITNSVMLAAIDLAQAGINEKQVYSTINEVMIREGGDYPGFVPFVRTNEQIPLGHTTFRNRVLQQGDTLFLEFGCCVRRYHAPIVRQLYIGQAPESAVRAEPVALEAFDAVIEEIKPGVLSGDVFQASQRVIEKALGYADKTHRPHCGYNVGIGFPPSWVGGGVVVGLRPNGAIEVRSGMVFHIIIWIGEPEIGDYALSDTVVVTPSGCDVLTTVPRGLTIK